MPDNPQAASTETALVYERVYAQGKLDVCAVAPPGHQDAVRAALKRSARITPWIDRAAFRLRLLESGVGREHLDAIVASAAIDEDESFYR